MARLFKDRFTAWLEAESTPPNIYQPGGMFGCPPIGWHHVMGGTSIVYAVRPQQPETLHIIMFERDQTRTGLGSSFACLIRFLRLLQHADVGITHVTGRIHAIEGRPSDSLATDRMKPFYVKHLKGHYFTDSEGIEWVRGSIVEALQALRGSDDS